MPAPSHLTLQQRKALCGRFLVLEAMSAHEADAIDAREAAFANTRELALAAATRAMVPGSPDDVRLDTFLGTVSLEIEEFASLRSVDSSVVTKKALKAASNALSTLKCDRCSPSHVCNGSDSDDAIVTASGHCLEPVRSTFQAVVAESIAYYSKYGDKVGHALNLPEVVLETVYHPRSPHSLPTAKAIGGAVRLNDTADGLQSIVTLHFHVEGFDAESVRALSYVLFHELICHAFDGTRPGPGPRIPSDQGDQFSEGWMDWVAGFIHGRASRGGIRLSPGALPFPIRDFDVGNRLRLSRCDLTQGTLFERGISARRELGARPAEAFERYLSRLLGPDVGTEAFLDISINLCLQRGVTAQRKAFVEFVDECLIQNVPEDEEKLAAVAGRVHNYLSSGDVRSLFGD